MLAMYQREYDSRRELVGVDLSPRLVSITRAKLGQAAKVHVGDMRNLEMIEPEAAAAAISYFAVHHLDPGALSLALREWKRITRRGGQLLAAMWEGRGPIDYGVESDIVAFRYTKAEIVEWAEAAGFDVDRCTVEPVEGFPMDAVYLEGTSK